MNEIGAKLNVLHEALDRKAKILEQIINITENQAMFFKMLKGAELNEYMSTALEEKQKLIDELNDIDSVFISIFESFKGSLNANRQKYREQIVSMQEKIKGLVVLDMKVRAKEEKNRLFIESMPNTMQNIVGNKIKGLKASKNYLLKQYARNKKGGSTPYQD